MGGPRLIGTSTLLLAACTLTTSLDGLSPQDPPPDPSEAGPVATDASDATEPPTFAFGTPFTIVRDVDVSFAAGAAQQTHLHYAKNANLWVLFYVDASDTTRLKTRASEDFATWTSGPSMVLPHAHANDGRNFAVSYLDVAGRDVFHFSVSLKPAAADRRHIHARGVIDARKLVFEAPSEIGTTTTSFASLDPDGPAVTVIPGGKVLDVTGWHQVTGNRVGNMLSFVSTDPETGSAWSPAFAPPVEVDVVTVTCNARTIVPMAGGALAVWEEGDEEPDPDDLRSSRFDGSSWTPAAPVGFTGPRFDPNDWGIARIDDANVHAVRVEGSAYAHRVFDGTAWKAGSTMPARAHAGGHGVAVLEHSGEILALALEGPTGALGATTFAGAAWSAWKEIVPPTGGRSGVAGYAGTGGVAAIWVETSGGQRNIVGVRIR